MVIQIDKNTYLKYKEMVKDFYLFKCLNNNKINLYYSLNINDDLCVKAYSPIFDINLEFNLSTITSSSDYYCQNKNDLLKLSCSVYLYELERKDLKENKNFLDRFVDLNKDKQAILNLSNTEKAKRNSIRLEFIKLFNIDNIKSIKAKDSSLKEDKELLSVYLTIEKNRHDFVFDNDVYELTLHIAKGNSRKYKISNLRNFLAKYAEHSKYKISSKIEEELYPSSFDENSSKFIEKISLLLNNSLYNDIITNNSIITELLLLIQDKLFTFNGKEYNLERIKVDAKIDTNGNINYSHELKPYIFYGNYLNSAIVIYKDEDKAQILDFDSEELAKLMYFQSEYNKESFEYVKDLFNEKVLPRISKDVIDVNIKKEDNPSFSIRLYIELTDKNTLIFKTAYFYNENEITDSMNFDNNSYTKIIRDLFIQILTSLGGVENGEIKDEDTILLFLKADLTQLRKVCDLYLNDALINKNVKSVGKVNIKVNGKENFLSLSLFCNDYTTEQIVQILQAYNKKKKFFRLNNDIILLDDENIKKVNEIKNEFKLDKDLAKEKLPFFEALKLKAFSSDNFNIEMNDYLIKAFNDIKDFKNYELNLSKDLLENLRDYQLDAIKWMSVLSKYHLSGVLADDMGLGKTLETISYLSLLKEEEPVLIVSPKSVIYNWKDEFKKWKQNINVTIIDGNKKERTNLINSIDNHKKEIFITSYDMLRLDNDIYENKKFNALILDEAQYIKNASALKSKAVKEIESKNRFALSGTPIENSLSDLWSIFDFLMPGYLPSYEKFRKEYEKEDSSKEELSKKVKPFILRRTKTEVLSSLPPKTTNVIKVTLTEKQKELYTAYLAKARANVFNNDEISQISVLSALTKLRQICVDPSSFIENYDEMSSKISITIDTIKNSLQNNHKVLVFSSFTTVLEHLRNYLDSENISSYYISGQTNGELRLSLANKFNNETSVNVMLVSLKAGGIGLNLQGADIVIHIDPWWNLASEEQATDRAYRIGQTRPVFVYKFIAFDTIEEKVLSLQQRKKDLYNSVIKTGEEGVMGLNKEDIKFLLS
ncbi:MAG: SNF2-related protein [Bacilli bacterium]